MTSTAPSMSFYSTSATLPPLLNDPFNASTPSSLPFIIATSSVCKPQDTSTKSSSATTAIASPSPTISPSSSSSIVSDDRPSSPPSFNTHLPTRGLFLSSTASSSPSSPSSSSPSTSPSSSLPLPLPLPPNTPLWREIPFLFTSDHSSTLFSPHCHFCLKVIGSLEDQLRSLHFQRALGKMMSLDKLKMKMGGKAKKGGGKKGEKKGSQLPEFVHHPTSLNNTELSTFLGSFPSLPPLFTPPLPCPLGCNEIFCSSQCLTLSLSSHHSISCPREIPLYHSIRSKLSSLSSWESKESDTLRERLRRYYTCEEEEKGNGKLRIIQFALSVDERILIVYKGICTIISKGEREIEKNIKDNIDNNNLDKIKYDIVNAIIAPYISFTHIVDFSSTKHKEFCDTISSLLSSALPEYCDNPIYVSLFTPEFITILLSTFDMNNIAIFSPHPIYTVLSTMHHVMSPTQSSSFSSLIGTSYSQLLTDMNTHHSTLSYECDITDTSLPFITYRVEGSGLFSYGSLMNHSCQPNIIPVKMDNKEEWKGFIDNHVGMTFQTVREVAVGEELCISYVEERERREERRRELKENYGFDCLCPKCEKEEREGEEEEEEEEGEEEHDHDHHDHDHHHGDEDDEEWGEGEEEDEEKAEASEADKKEKK